MNEMFGRTELLLGSEAMQKLSGTKVIVFGVGGVGGWCAEALVRSGIGNITIVDKDCVAASNINRQVMATTSSIGRSKVEVLKERLMDINPQLVLKDIHDVYTAETAAQYNLDDYDFVIDAIDSLADKALLIQNACRSRATLLSSMGAALKSNIRRIQVAEFWKVKGCPLARALRNHFKRTGMFPTRKFKCVYSDELLRNQCDTDLNEPHANGTLMHATAVFGLTLASMVIDSVTAKAQE